jgi:hypothetical protein
VSARGSAGPGGDLPAEEMISGPVAPVDPKSTGTPALKPKRHRRTNAEKAAALAASKAASNNAPSPSESTASRGGIQGDVDMDQDEAERAAQEGVRGPPRTRHVAASSLTLHDDHATTQAAHQLAAETLLSIGPNSRSAPNSAAANAAERPRSSNSNLDPSLQPLDMRGMKRKSIEDVQSSGARTPDTGSPKRRALSPNSHSAYNSMYGGASASSLIARHAQQSVPRDNRERALLARDVDIDKEREMQSLRRQRILEEDQRVRERDLEKERAKEIERERERRALGLPSTILGGDPSSRPPGSASEAGAGRQGGMFGPYGSAGSGARASPFKYGGLFEHDRYGYSRAGDRKDAVGQGAQNRPSGWVNPLVSQPSAAASSSNPAANSLTRKELQDHRDSLLEGKKWLEERLAKTDKLLSQLNEKLTEQTTTSRPGSQHSNGTSNSSTP